MNNPYTTWVKVATLAHAAQPVAVQSSYSFREAFVYYDL